MESERFVDSLGVRREIWRNQDMMRMKLGKIFITILFVVLGLVRFTEGYAQKDDFFVVAGRLSADDGNKDNGEILIMKNGVEEQTFTPPRNGRFSFDFEYNNEFYMTFFKDGYYQKIIIVSTHVPQKVLEVDNEFPPYQIDVSLVKEIPGVDKSFSNKPAGRVYYNATIDNFDSEVYFSDIQLEEQAANARAQEQALTEEQRAAQAQREADYQRTIARANSLTAEEKYEAAIAQFQSASGLFPERDYPKDRIAELNDLMSALRLAEERRSQVEQDYQSKISQADVLFQSEEYEQARAMYEQALTFLPDENYPKEKIAEIDEVLVGLVEQAQLEQQFNETVDKAETAFGRGEFQLALDGFNKALALKPGDQQVKDRIVETEEMVWQLKQKQQFDALVARADQAFEQEEYEQSKAAYQQALAIFPQESHPISQIAKIDALLLEIQKREGIDQQYAQAMRQAENAFKADQLEEALRLFGEASTLKPEEELPPSRIADIENLISQRQELAQLAAEEAQQEAAILQAKRVSYEAALAEAERAVDQKEYATAKNHLVDALNIIPGEQFPRDRIAQIDLLIEQEALARMDQLRQAQQDSLQQARRRAYDQKIALAEQSEQAEEFENAINSYFEAKEILPANAAEVDRRIELVRAKMLEKQGIEASYANSIREGDRLFGNQDWQNARSRYEEGLSYKPDATYPAEQLQLISQRLEAIESSYAEAIRLGDQLFNDESWSQARARYNEALAIKPQEQYPADQLTKIVQLEQQREPVVVQQPVVEALVVPPVPTTVVSDLYEEFLTSADDSYNQQDYKVAQYYYQKALNERPDESYPKQRIREISDLINQTMSQNELAAYEEAIKKADQAFAEKQYSISKFHYSKALEVKSWEQYPKDQIQEIQGLTNSLLSQLKEKEYQDLIAKADEAFIKKDYAVARAYYNRSLTIKLDEQYPKIKLEEVAVVLEQQLLNADEQAYQNFISEGDKAMLENNFSVARFYYQKALGLKPNESYPQGQLKVIKESLSSVN